jgi:GDP-4-dehydro-6-deoxy-D-mannose reductase
MKKILILGSEGFTGRYFYHYIQKNRLAEKCYQIDQVKLYKPKKELYYHINLLDEKEIFQFLCHHKPDAIFNFAGLIFNHDFVSMIQANVTLVEILFNAILRIKNYFPKILTIGTAAEYGYVESKHLPINENCPRNPVNNYGLSKVYLQELVDKYSRTTDLQIYMVKPFNLIGPGQSEQLIMGSISRQIERIKKGLQPNEVYVGNTDRERDFLDVRDAVSAYYRLVQSEHTLEPFNVGSGRPTRIDRMIANYIEFTKLNITIVEKEIRKKLADPYSIYADISKISQKIGWQPEISLDQSLYDIYQYNKNSNDYFFKQTGSLL